ncbi:MAG TPA: HEAT repeat domain-containing protein [Granulicella sp.]|jgi:hypothetical protein|nr:HEAT repeat domain-containing protein [Granulicella sp.]
MLALSLALLTSLTPQSQSVPPPTDVPPFAIAIDQPAYTGQPVWIHAVDGPRQNIRYPFRPAAGDIGCNRLELKHNGVLLTPLPVRGPANMDGILCGSAAPQGSPTYRLPLHILYPFQSPGTYSVRLTVLAPLPGNAAVLQPEARSEWLTFTVPKATPEQHEAWIRNLLANVPEDDGHLAGDFLPSLLAAAPDPRALETFVKYLHAENPMASGMAASALEAFPQPEVLRVVAESLEEHGPSDELAYFASYHTGWTREDQSKIVHATLGYLEPTPTQTAAANQINPIHFLRSQPRLAYQS